MPRILLGADDPNGTLRDLLNDKAKAAGMSAQKYITFLIEKTEVVSRVVVVTSEQHTEQECDHVASHTQQKRIRR